jgi:DNA-binding CsgD family transcriptional regulator
VAVAAIRRTPYLSVMGRLTEPQLRRVFGFIESAVLGTPSDPLPRASLAALRNLLEADEAEYFELRRADRAVVAIATSDDLEDAPGTDEALACFGHENPLNWRRWQPADGAMRLSGVVRHRDLRSTGYYDAFMRPNHLRDNLKVWLWSSSRSAACVQLWRRDGEFGRVEEDMLAVLHEHLIHLREQALIVSSPTVVHASLTVREAEILTWAARGLSDAAIGARLGLSGATVGKHLEHAYVALGVHSRAEAVGRLAFSPRASTDPAAGPSV